MNKADRPYASPKTDVAQEAMMSDGARRDIQLVKLLTRLPSFRATLEPASARQIALAYGASLLIELVAIWARFVIDPYLPPGFPYLTFFPAVILTGFIFGMGPALLNTVISGGVAWYWFIPPVQSLDINAQSATALIFFFIVIGIDLGLLRLLLMAYAQQMRAREDLTRHLHLQQLVSEEVDHRLKNLLATTSGLISLSQRHASTPEQLGAQLRQRIQAMGHSIALLRGSLHGGSTSMRDAILSSVEPLGLTLGDRLSFEGPVLRLNGSSIISLSLIMHELGTNAFKYGALSRESGRIRIHWQLREEVGGDDEAEPTRWIELTWEERGGPQVTPPSNAGFGTELVRRLAKSYGSDCKLDYQPEGLCVTLRMLADTVLASQNE
ncbi:sensor histidine kinase [Rhizobium helianthi]|uniref:histidine kinase n=1 Tax=Rhizobium helianthi TaxID=1132695 RepID=A0ABW4M1I8_9HYPH